MRGWQRYYLTVCNGLLGGLCAVVVICAAWRIS